MRWLREIILFHDIYVITVRSFSRSPGTKYKHKTLQFSQKCGLTKLRENRWKFSQLWCFRINWCIIRLWENFTNIQQNWFIKIVTLNGTTMNEFLSKSTSQKFMKNILTQVRTYIRVRIDKPDLSITDYFTWDDSVRSFYSTTYM